MLIKGNIKYFGGFAYCCRRQDTSRQDNQIIFPGFYLITFGQILNYKIIGMRVFGHGRYTASDIIHTAGFSPLVIFIEALTVGAHVHVKDVAFQIISGMFLGNDSLFGGIHAAYR